MQILLSVRIAFVRGQLVSAQGLGIGLSHSLPKLVHPPELVCRITVSLIGDRIVLSPDLKPGEYAFFMGTGQQSAMAGSMAGKGAGGAATGRVYDFTIPD